MARRIESYLLDGPAGKLEALLEEPEEGAAGALAFSQEQHHSAKHGVGPCPAHLDLSRPSSATVIA